MTIKNICSSWLFGNVSVCNRNWRNAHFVENHVISRTFIHHLYMELKISHGSILFWRADAPPPPKPPPPPTSTPVSTLHTPKKDYRVRVLFQDSSTPPPLSLSLSLSLSHMVHPQTYCISTSPCKPTLTSSIKTYIVHYKSKNKVDNLVLAFLLYSCGGDVVVVVLIFVVCRLKESQHLLWIHRS